MTLADLALVAEIVGVTGILISLIFVLRQLRLANDQLEKAQSANRIAVEMAASIPAQNVFLARAQDAELSNLFLRAVRGRESVSPEDWQRFSAYIYACLYQAQTGYRLIIQGDSDPSVFKTHNAAVSALLNTPGGREWVKSHAIEFSQDTRGYIMGLAGLGPLATSVELPEGFPVPERHDLKDGASTAL